MGKALEQLCFGLDRVQGPAPRGVVIAHYDLGLIVDAVREIRELQRERADLEAELNRLRAATAPVTVYATDAVVTFGPAGVTLQAPMVEMRGDVTVAA